MPWPPTRNRRPTKASHRKANRDGTWLILSVSSSDRSWTPPRPVTVEVSMFRSGKHDRHHDEAQA